MAYNGKERVFVRYSRVNVVEDSLPEGTYEKFSVGVFGGHQKQFFIIFDTMAGLPSIRLEACSSSWDFLYECQDILERLSNIGKDNLKPDDIYYTLMNLGIRDITSNINTLSKT